MKIGIKKQYGGVLDIPARKCDGVEVRHVRKPTGTMLVSGTMRTALFGQKSEKIVFDQPTVWHELHEKGHGLWMSDYPVEQRQADELIARSQGRVLVGGLGLGYAVVALAARAKVKEIVVIEQNAAIIKLVWAATVKRVRLMGNARVKLSVIHADLFAYLKARQAAKKAKPEFTWGLFDIWQGDGEATFHEVVVPLRALAHGVVASLACWNEDIMRGQLLQGMENRLLMVRNPKQFSNMVSLDMLTSDSESIYVQWAVPFWQWYKDHVRRGNEELVRYIMRQYVLNYGRPEAVNRLPALRPYRPETEDAVVEATP